VWLSSGGNKMFATKTTLLILALGLSLAPLVPARAAEPVEVAELADSFWAEAIEDRNRQEALSYIEEQLLLVEPGCQAEENLLEFKEDILAGEANPAFVAELARTWRTEQFALLYEKYLFKNGQ
jgi:hypothetical protein